MTLLQNLISNPNPRIFIPKPPIPPLCNQIRPNPRFRITFRRQFHGAHLRSAVVRAEKEDRSGSVNGDGEEEELKKPRFSLNWGQLLLDPDPDNIAAVGLAGLLTWASVQVVWQLLAVSAAILVAALKYSFVAALLLFILIALL